MSDLHQVDQAIAALINRTSPASRRKMNSALVRKLRQRQQISIQKQQAPDGTPYAPRKNKKPGKRVMFRRLRTVRFMKTRSTPDDMTISFTQGVQNIARIHHYGLREKIETRGRKLEIKYARRQLIGLTHHDVEIIGDSIIDFLSK
ncbi:phage virion morphogenesis protein [Limnobaculum xujianqingii]|uniref:phage virion morphogenesis protein n=1 Tax=Limnobaculum xujianqingii TaxID=2738837 RepID=UPI0015C1669F|nr:phage virion morphogenesis protein [Limnobaculum xujianqingii]